MIDKKKLRELANASTRVVGWYPHSQYDGYHPGRASVRGPFGRWFLVEGANGEVEGSPIYPVADLYDDAKFAAAAMNNLVALLDRIDELENAYDIVFEALAKRQRDDRKTHET